MLTFKVKVKGERRRSEIKFPAVLSTNGHDEGRQGAEMGLCPGLQIASKDCGLPLAPSAQDAAQGEAEIPRAAAAIRCYWFPGNLKFEKKILFSFKKNLYTVYHDTTECEMSSMIKRHFF